MNNVWNVIQGNVEPILVQGNVEPILVTMGPGLPVVLIGALVATAGLWGPSLSRLPKEGKGRTGRELYRYRPATSRTAKGLLHFDLLAFAACRV